MIDRDKSLRNHLYILYQQIKFLYISAATWTKNYIESIPYASMS
jgi:hypothetical protein